MHPECRRETIFNSTSMWKSPIERYNEEFKLLNANMNSDETPRQRESVDKS